MTLPPGPRQSVAVQTARWIYRPGPFMEECRRNHGELFTVRFAQAGNIMFISDPEVVKEVFRGRPEVFLAGAANQQFEDVFGARSILLLDGKEHLRQRRLMLPPFRRRSPAALRGGDQRDRRGGDPDVAAGRAVLAPPASSRRSRCR